MAGTRPPDISASTVTAAPFDVGSMTPIGRPSGASGISFAPRMRVACSSRLYVSWPLVGSSNASHLPPWMCAASITASTTVRSIRAVRNIRFDMMS